MLLQLKRQLGDPNHPLRRLQCQLRDEIRKRLLRRRAR